MADFVEAATIDEIPESGVLCLEVDDRFVVIVRIEDKYYCLDDVCTHDGGTLGDGELVDGCLECPRHGARFDVKTGDAVTMPATEPTTSHEVKITGETIMVRLAD